MGGPRSLESAAAEESSLAAGLLEDGPRSAMSVRLPTRGRRPGWTLRRSWNRPGERDAFTPVDRSVRPQRSEIRRFSRYRWIDPAGTPWPRSSLDCAALTSFPTRPGVLRRSRHRTTGPHGHLPSVSWSPERESNSRPTHYECVALPTELSGRAVSAGRDAIGGVGIVTTTIPTTASRADHARSTCRSRRTARTGRTSPRRTSPRRACAGSPRGDLASNTRSLVRRRATPRG